MKDTTMNALISQALSTGALERANGNAAGALAKLAQRDSAAAQTFASKARTARERVELCLAIDAPGTSYAAARATLVKMGQKDPDRALELAYGA
jgi:hypothetical protein